MVFTGESGIVMPYAVTRVRGVGPPFEFHAFPSPYCRIFFILLRLLAIINLA